MNTTTADQEIKDRTVYEARSGQAYCDKHGRMYYENMDGATCRTDKDGRGLYFWVDGVWEQRLGTSQQHSRTPAQWEAWVRSWGDPMACACNVAGA